MGFPQKHVCNMFCREYGLGAPTPYRDTLDALDSDNTTAQESELTGLEEDAQSQHDSGEPEDN
jgi:stringent starvation protein B